MKKLYERAVYQVSAKEKESDKYHELLQKMNSKGFNKIVDRYSDSKRVYHIVFEKEAPGNGWDIRELGHR